MLAEGFINGAQSESHESSHSSYASFSDRRKFSLPKFLFKLYGGSAKSRSKEFFGRRGRISKASPFINTFWSNLPGSTRRTSAFRKTARSTALTFKVRFLGARVLEPELEFAIVSGTNSSIFAIVQKKRSRLILPVRPSASLFGL